ncbi:MAG TPA: hypothetical protein VNS32_26435 [Flavisolibacter sp.]|nr:hypothetical protein [Flavisolibacter sp.]
MKKTGTFFLKRDNLKLGLLLGLISPLLVLLLIYFMKFSSFTLEEFMNAFFRERSLITFFGVWCLVGNIALFTFYINTRRDQTAKGIFAVTLIYGIGVLVLKLFA